MQRFINQTFGVLILSVLAVGCATTSATSRSSSGSSVGVTGESSAKGSVELFMRAVKAQDLQQMSTAWGTTKGPARDQMDRETLEKRLIVIQCMLSHDSWSFAENEPRLQAGGRREFVVEVRKKQLRAKTSFTTVQGSDDRWYVEIVDVAPLKEFCN